MGSRIKTLQKMDKKMDGRFVSVSRCTIRCKRHIKRAIKESLLAIRQIYLADGKAIRVANFCSPKFWEDIGEKHALLRADFDELGGAIRRAKELLEKKVDFLEKYGYASAFTEDIMAMKQEEFEEYLGKFVEKYNPQKK